MLPDAPGIDKVFDYEVPVRLAGEVRVGTVVRVPLHGRRSGGWVVDVPEEPPAGIALKPLAKVTGWGPSPDVVELAEWAAWRWAGRRAHFLRTASPQRAVRGLPSPADPTTVITPAPPDELAQEALTMPRAVVRLPPAADTYPLVAEAASRGRVLVVTPAHATAARLAARLRRAGVPVALLPDAWAQAAAGCRVVIGTRAAAWAPAPDLDAVVVLDEHDESLQQESAPTWHARSVAAERARRVGVPCVLVSPCPSLEALRWGPLLRPSRADERAGWPVVDVADRRREDPARVDLYSPRLVAVLRDVVARGDRAVCVLNRKGRARLLACVACAELTRCERCGAAVQQDEEGLHCARCGARRPSVCAACGGTRLKVLRPGVRRVREDLERLVGAPVAEVTADPSPAGGNDLTDAMVLVGTEAVLHRAGHAKVVAFLDFDQELLAPRYRAAEEALALLVHGARLVGGRSGGGRLLVQTRLPQHDVIEAALHADPARFAVAESAHREALALPPGTAIAEVSGEAAPAFIDALRASAPAQIEVLGPANDRWLVRAPGHRALCDTLAGVPRPPGRLRVAVDPPRV